MLSRIILALIWLFGKCLYCNHFWKAPGQIIFTWDVKRICFILNKLTFWQNALQDKFAKEANTMNPDQTAPKEAVWFGSKLFAMRAIKVHKQMRMQTIIVLNGCKKRLKLFSYTMHATTLWLLMIKSHLDGPHHEKTCLQGFRQSEFQNSLLSYRD